MEFNDNDVRGIVAEAVRRKMHLFCSFKDIGREDLLQEGMIRARQVHEKFDPKKAAYSTWIYRAVSCRLIDLCRVRSRQASRDALVPRGEAVAAPPGADGPADPPELAEWLHGVYAAAMKVHGKVRVRTGRKWFNPAQAVALVMLMRRQKLSTRGAVVYLQTRPDLCTILRLRHVPSRMFFQRAEKFVTDNLKLPERGLVGLVE